MGDEVRTPIDAMYRAGKLDIPAEADWVSTVANRLHDALHSFNTQSALAGDPQVMTSMLKIGGEIYEEMRSTLISLDHCAEAVVKTADDFVATDAQARDDYAHLGKGLKDTPTPTHSVPEPLPDLAAPGGAAPVQPSRMGLGDFQPHPETQVGSTPDPVAPSTDQAGRDQTQQHDTAGTPVVPPVVR